jgi:hypothetical protein
MNSGRLVDILVTDKYKGHSFTIWADKGKEEVIGSVEGVTYVFKDHLTEYKIFYDPRYDMETVINNILEKIK